MSILGRAVGLSAVVFAVGCGGSGPSPASHQVLAVPPGGPRTPAALERASAPPDVFVVARLSGVGKLADTVVGWSSLPLDWRTLLAREAPGFDQTAVIDAPVDFAAMLDRGFGMEPKVLWAFAFGVVSTEAAARYFRTQGGEVVGSGGDAYRIRLGSDLVCLATRALGAAPARVVCSAEADSLDALAPYMSRGMPTESFGPADLHAHVLAEPFRRRYGAQLGLLRTVGVPFLLREVALGHPGFDGALRDVLYASAEEAIALARDIDRIEVEATLTPRSDAIALRTALTLAGQSSWTSGMLTRAAGRAGVAPEFFWKLPADALAASYGARPDGEQLRPVAAALGRLADGWLDHQKLPEARRSALVAAFEAALTWSAQSVYASFPPPPGEAAPAVTSHLQRADEELRAVLRAAAGGHVFAVDGGGERLIGFASEFVKALGDRTFREHLVQSKLVGDGDLPTLRQRAPKGAGLPRGTRVFELTLAAPKALKPATKAPRAKGTEAPQAPLSVVLVALPDGALTWFGFGTDEKAVLGRLEAARFGTGVTLASRDGLAALRSEPAGAAGFSTIAAAISGIPTRGLLDLPSLDRLPHRGQTPIFWKVTAEGHGPALVFHGSVPKAVVEDLVGLVASIGK